MTQTQNEAEFELEWLLRQKNEFKILTLIAVLADNNLAYRGTLKDMCEFFGVKPGDSRTNNQIKAAITELEADGLLKQIVDGRTFTLTLSKKGEQRKRVIRIQKEWVEIAEVWHGQGKGEGPQDRQTADNQGWHPRSLLQALSFFRLGPDECE